MTTIKKKTKKEHYCLIAKCCFSCAYYFPREYLCNYSGKKTMTFYICEKYKPSDDRVYFIDGIDDKFNPLKKSK